VWCGIEYQVASHLIYEELVHEGLAIVKGLRERHDGRRRNPWNEFECGSNYARSLASYALLNAFSGFQFDMTKGLIGFDPVRLTDGRFRGFWSLDSAWGVFSLSPGRLSVEVKAGSLSIKTLELPFLRGGRVRSVSAASKKLAFRQTRGGIELARKTRIRPRAPLVITFSR
jgi:hypothetical protein